MGRCGNVATVVHGCLGARMRTRHPFLFALLLLSCGGGAVNTPASPTAPTPSPTLSTASGSGPGASISGVIRDGWDGSPVPQVRVWINDHPATATDGDGNFSIFVSVKSDGGTPYIGFDKVGFSGRGNTVYLGNGLRLDVIMARRCALLPYRSPTASVQPGWVDFQWDPYPGVSDYIIEVGIITSANPLVVDPAGHLKNPNVLSQPTGGKTFYRWDPPNIGAGTYWVRIRNRNDCGLSDASLDTLFKISE